MSDFNPSNCPKCKSEYIYEDGNLWVCPECSHEWSAFQNSLDKEKETVIRDGVGNALSEGDSAVMIKDVKIGGSSSVLKQGVRIQNIRFEDNGPHNIVAKVDGFGIMELKSELIKKI